MPKRTWNWVKQCPTCVEFIEKHSRQAYFDHHQSVVCNTKAKCPKWYHRTKLGRNIHQRGVNLFGELLDPYDTPPLGYTSCRLCGKLYPEGRVVARCDECIEKYRQSEKKRAQEN